ncbi:MAG: hypothetical protein U1F23_01145 [Lysobacterales bacterium]
MKIQRNIAPILLALSGALTLAACSKAPEPAAPATPPATTPAPSAPEATTTPPAETPAPAPAPVSVTSVDLGSAVGPDQKVTMPSTTFEPKDTIYAAVSTDGSASNATLSAKWTYQDGQTVNESSETIAPTGAATTAFHISKPDGWPTGNYKVEISLDGKVVATKDFSVK